MVFSLPNCNGADRVEAWPRLIDEANAVDGGDRRVFLLRELNYGCKGDFPLTHTTSLDRIDDDFRVFSRYGSAVSCVGGVYTYHSLGWLLSWYSMRKQWDTRSRWQDWLPAVTCGSLGQKASGLAVTILEKLRDVQLYEGLTNGEYVIYYSRWGLDLHMLAPETLPSGPSPFAQYPAVGPFVRLVAVGSQDADGLHDTRTCLPAEKRLHSLRAILGGAERETDQLEAALSPGKDRAFWEEHLIQPFRWTAAFLRSRTALALSYCRYIQVREGLLEGTSVSGLLDEGEWLCREALDTQDLYIRLRPGFSLTDYPHEVNPSVIRQLIRQWRELRSDTAPVADLSLCAFLDRAEQEAGSWPTAAETE